MCQALLLWEFTLSRQVCIYSSFFTSVEFKLSSKICGRKWQQTLFIGSDFTTRALKDTHGDHLNHLGEGVVVEGVPSSLSSLDVQNSCVWMVSERFCMEPGVQMGSFCISKQDLQIQQLSRDICGKVCLPFQVYVIQCLVGSVSCPGLMLLGTRTIVLPSLYWKMVVMQRLLSSCLS